MWTVALNVALNKTEGLYDDGGLKYGVIRMLQFEAFGKASNAESKDLGSHCRIC